MGAHNDLSIHRRIEKECDRLQLNATWRRTIDLYLRRFESAALDSNAFNNCELVGEPEHHIEIEIEAEDRASLTILNTLIEIDDNNTEQLKKILFSQSVAKLPVFFLRAKRDTADGPVFWDPLEETLQEFLHRATVAKDNVRRYTSLTSLHGDDIIAARVFKALSCNNETV